MHPAGSNTKPSTLDNPLGLVSYPLSPHLPVLSAPFSTFFLFGWYSRRSAYLDDWCCSPSSYALWSRKPNCLFSFSRQGSHPCSGRVWIGALISFLFSPLFLSTYRSDIQIAVSETRDTVSMEMAGTVPEWLKKIDSIRRGGSFSVLEKVIYFQSVFPGVAPWID